MSNRLGRLNYTVRFAIDKKSVRTFDADGRMHVSTTPISKANICPYLGKEIPDADKLGLEPDKIYQLLRHPAELAKAAPTFNGIQILRKHIPVSVDDHQPHEVIGATGTDAVFAAPYLKNSLVFWPKADIKDIESDAKKQLSSAYRYRADMTPGEYEGVHYDGVMRDIVGNHVALVEEGRAGSDVAVGDGMPDFGANMEAQMSKVRLTRKGAQVMGALLPFMKPRLAADAKLDYGKLLGTVSTANYSSKKGAIVAGLREQTRGKLAKDASVNGLVELLDSLDSGGKAGDDDLMTEPNSGMPMGGEEEEASADADAHAGLRSVLEAAGIAPEVIEKACAAVGGGGDADLEDPLPKKGPLGSKSTAEEGEDEDPAEEESLGEEKGAKFAKAKDKKAKDEPPPFKGKPVVGGSMSKDEVNKLIAVAVKNAQIEAQTAMDTALATVKSTAHAIREAERFVRPWVGDLQIAADSAADVYKTALLACDVDVKGIHPSAFRKLLELCPHPGKSNNKAAEVELSMDSASAPAKSFAERFPQAARIQLA